MKKLSRQEKIEQYKELVLLEREKCSRDFYFYFKRAWEIVEPKTPLLENWHHELIAEYLTACYLRQIKKLIINIPPRYAKSNLATVIFPTWVWINDPEERFLFTSYSSGLSTMHSLHRRNILESKWYHARWGNIFRMATDQNVKTEYENDKRGRMIATSMAGTATGKGGNFLMIDDPHDTTRAESTVKRESDILEFDQKFSTRLDDKERGIIIIIMQRLHTNDLTGHCLEQGDWEHLKVPCEAHEKTTIIFPISGKKIVRKEGEILHPAREDRKALAKQKKSLGSYGYASQYQQLPSPREGGILKRHYWQRYNVLPTRFEEIIDSWDFSFKKLTDSSMVCGTVWGRVKANKYLIHLVMRKMGFADSLKAILNMRVLYPKIERSIVEDKANGSAIIETAKNSITGILAFNPQGSKEERAAAIEPQCESGNVFLPTKEFASFDVQAYIDNLANFPNAKYSDDVDSTTMALLYMSRDENIEDDIKETAKNVQDAEDSESIGEFEGAYFTR